MIAERENNLNKLLLFSNHFQDIFRPNTIASFFLSHILSEKLEFEVVWAILLIQISNLHITVCFTWLHLFSQRIPQNSGFVECQMCSQPKKDSVGGPIAYWLTAQTLELAWLWILALSFVSCVTLAKLLTLLCLSFIIRKMGMTIIVITGLFED